MLHLHIVRRTRLSATLNLNVLTVALVVTALDAVTKAWARRDLVGHSIHVLGPMWFKLQFNSGVSFSFNQSGVTVTSVGTAIIALVVLVAGLRANAGLATAGFGLLVGGGLANVIDRLSASPHEVTDFIAVGNFPVFNPADACITVGFIVLMVATLRGERLLQK